MVSLVPQGQAFNSSSPHHFCDSYMILHKKGQQYGFQRKKAPTSFTILASTFNLGWNGMVGSHHTWFSIMLIYN